MYDYVSLSTCTRLPSSSALVVSLGGAVDSSFVTASANSIVTTHLVVDVGSALVPFGRAGTGGAGHQRTATIDEKMGGNDTIRRNRNERAIYRRPQRNNQS